MAQGRPRAEDSDQREARFAVLVAGDFALDVAAKTAQVKAERALKLLSTPAFARRVEVLRCTLLTDPAFQRDLESLRAQNSVSVKAA